MLHVVFSKRTKGFGNVGAIYGSIGLCLLCVYVHTHTLTYTEERK